MVRPKKEISQKLDKAFILRLTEEEYLALQKQKQVSLSMSSFIRKKLFLTALDQCPSQVMIKTFTDMTDSFNEHLVEQKKILNIIEGAYNSGTLDESNLELIIKNWRRTEEAHKKTQRFIARLLKLYAKK